MENCCGWRGSGDKILGSKTAHEGGPRTRGARTRGGGLYVLIMLYIARTCANCDYRNFISTVVYRDMAIWNVFAGTKNHVGD